VRPPPAAAIAGLLRAAAPTAADEPPSLARLGLKGQALVFALLGALAFGPAAVADEASEAARTLLAIWHEEPARIDRARALLESAAAARPSAEMLTELARAWFLTGDIRAGSEADKLAAYEHGAAAARRAIALAPNSDEAHLWFALNTGRFAETRGSMKALGLLPTIREASDTVLRLNPRNVDGLILAGGILAEVPRLMGGDRARAEAHFKRALEVDPHKTAARIELARLYIATKRWAEARRELQRVLEEPAASDLPRWTMREVPRARALLAELAEREPQPATTPGQSP
jgi:tetratricopeptide (TPR) repeat protein